VKVAITGATGGIGRALVAALKPAHEVTGIVRSAPPASGDISYASYADAAGLAAALGDADCVIHNALNSKAKARAFLAVNELLNRDILAGALRGRCTLYVYVSSQVVYSGIDPATPEGYREDQALLLTDKLDDYTRLKIEEERRVVAACRAAGIGYLILRPTVVMGPGMAWSDGVVKASGVVTVGIKRRTMNLIHVDDLARFVVLLLERGAHDAVFNLGTQNFSSEAYFGEVGRITGRRPLFVPDWVMTFAGKVLPSTMWFFGRNVGIDSRKVVETTGLHPDRRLANYFSQRPREIRGDTLEALQTVQRSGQTFRAHGQGYSHWFNPAHGENRLAMGGYSGIVASDDDEITVKSGTRLIEIAEYLDAKDRALPTLPEFSGISAGACFFADVHGSSNEAFSLYEFVTAIKYLDADGNELTSARDEALWAELRIRRENFILTELTFRTVPAGFLSNRIEWQDDSALLPYLTERHRENHITTLHWYPYYKRLLIYHINRAESPTPGTAPSISPFRGLPYRLQQILLQVKLRGRAVQIDRHHKILAPWQTVPFEPVVKYLMTRPKHAWRDLEFCVSLADAIALVEELRAMEARGEIRFRRRMGIGMRFSYRQTGEGFVWIEFVSNEPPFVEAFLATARRVAKDGVVFHSGKYVPR
jgi:nucleoside-diphosphate-sugar epimerase